MRDSKTIIKNGYLIELNNYRYAEVIIIQKDHHRRVYHKDHLRKLSMKEFKNLYNKVDGVDLSQSPKDLFMLIEKLGFEIER
jgi:hypothetical protein